MIKEQAPVLYFLRSNPYRFQLLRGHIIRGSISIISAMGPQLFLSFVLEEK